jgi:hypothetical protein
MAISSEHLPDDASAIPALVRSIEPSYAVERCDCYMPGWHPILLVLAFAPK